MGYQKLTTSPPNEAIIKPRKNKSWYKKRNVITIHYSAVTVYAKK
jgi:hypothetical protein